MGTLKSINQAIITVGGRGTRLKEVTKNMNGIEFLRRKEVEKKTTLSKNSIYNFMREGNFPKSIEIRPKVVVWIKSEVEEWMDAQIVASRIA